MTGKQRTRTFDKTESSRATLPDGVRVYAIGDIHGRLDLLERLLCDIARDRKDTPAKRNVLIFLGDYVDRGPSSKGVIDCLTSKLPSGFETVFLKGNHEDLMLRFIKAPSADKKDIEGPNWMMNGGEETLESYGVDIPSAERGRAIDIDSAVQGLRAKIPKEHLSFLKNLSLSHVEGDFAFVHAGFKPGVTLARQTESDMIWIRDEFLIDTRLFDNHVAVHGHSIRAQPEVKPNRIGIDTGAWYSGKLTALALEKDEYWFLHT